MTAAPVILCTETICDVPLVNGFRLCHDHTTELERRLDELPGALADLGAATIRATRYGTSVTAAQGEPALIVDFEASALGHELAALIHSWTDLTREALGAGFTPDDPRSPASCARWLRRYVPTIRHQDWAGDMLDEFKEALWVARRGADKPADRVFAGMCPTDIDGAVCDSPLYALRGRGVVTCRTCGADWDANGWRADALEAAGMHTGTAVEISRALSDPVTGEALPSATIRQWVKRGKLTHVNEVEIRLAELFGQRVPAKVYQIRKVRNLWARMQASKYGNPTHKKPSDSTSVAA